MLSVALLSRMKVALWICLRRRSLKIFFTFGLTPMILKWNNINFYKCNYHYLTENEGEWWPLVTFLHYKFWCFFFIVLIIKRYLTLWSWWRILAWPLQERRSCQLFLQSYLDGSDPFVCCGTPWCRIQLAWNSPFSLPHVSGKKQSFDVDVGIN